VSISFCPRFTVAEADDCRPKGTEETEIGKIRNKKYKRKSGIDRYRQTDGERERER